MRQKAGSRRASWRNKLGDICFNQVYGHNLIYNTSWEDPRLDRVALDLGPEDSLLTITSAGCNVLDYALLGPKHIYAVDMNYRQNALLELKLAGIRVLEFDAFFAMFGRGYLDNHRTVYQTQLRPLLSPAAQGYWDRHIAYFAGKGWQRTFYFHGTSGLFARLMNTYIDHIALIRDGINALFAVRSLDEQRDIYYRYLRCAIRKRFFQWLVKQDVTLSLIGLPSPQRQQVERGYKGGLMQFIEDCVESVFTRLPFWDNYFWRVYLQGAYSPECCPEYLKPVNFKRLKGGLINRISVHTDSLVGFLTHHDVGISRYVLLDHMDWLSTSGCPILQQEWQAMIDRALPGTRILWRSGGLQVDYVDPIKVIQRGRRQPVGNLLTYYHDLAEELHRRDRVHTYGSFYIADLATA